MSATEADVVVRCRACDELFALRLADAKAKHFALGGRVEIECPYCKARGGIRRTEEESDD